MQNENYLKLEEAKRLMQNFSNYKAEKILEELMELEPNDSMVKFYYGKILAKKKSRQSRKKAKELFGQIINTPSKNFALVELAKLELEDEEFDKARDHLEELKQLSIRNRNKKDLMIAELELGRIDVAQELYISARKRFDKVICEGNERDKAYAYQESGRLYVTFEEYDAARKEFKKLFYINKGKSKSFALLELGRLETKVRNNNIARQYFNELIEIGNKKDKACALLELGKLEISDHNYAKAEKYLNRLIAESKNSIDINSAKLLLGIVAQHTDGYDKSKEHFVELLDTDNRESALIELADLELRYKNYEQTQEYLDMIEKNANKKIRDRKKAILGAMEALRNNDKEARQLLEPLVNCSDSRIKYQALHQLAYIEFNDMNLDKAKEYFTKLLACVSPEHQAVAILNLIFIDLKEENYESALAKINEYKDRKEVISEMNHGTWEDINFYTKYKLGIETKKSKDWYFCDQIVSYDEERSINHIIEDFQRDGFDKDESILDNGLIELFKELKINIMETEPTNFSIVDKYKINFGRVIGKIKEQDTSSVIVQTLLNTKNIFHSILYTMV